MISSSCNFAARITKALQERDTKRLRRSRVIVENACGPTLQWQGKALHNFASNDYLGHANHPKVKAAFTQSVSSWGVGSGGSHLITGHTRAHQALEDQLAELCACEAALVFSTGFMANLGIISALLTPEDTVLEDRLNHASLLDGGLHSGAKFARYPHVDIHALQKKLNDEKNAGNTLMVSDGVFSMDGDIAPIPELLASARADRDWLMIDDAHGFGVLGKNGLGSPEHFHLAHKRIPIYMATLGKAIGTFGAFVAGSKDLIDYLIQFARPYVYTTAMPAALASATSASLNLLHAESWRRTRVLSLVQHFRERALAAGLPLLPSITPIQPLMIGDSQRALAISTQLRERGFWVSAIRAPTVPVNTARLRITFSAEHDEKNIDQLVDCLADLMQAHQAADIGE